VGEVLYQGAEAKICKSEYLGMSSVEKRRLKKSYRISEIDSRLISQRTREEVKLISLARKCGVCAPLIYDVDVSNGVIVMEYLNGDKIKDILDGLSESEQEKLCFKIGQSIARLHNNGIIHGDITTSNMILVDDKVHFIDFGLGCIDSEVESMGVDLHVLMEAFESTHSQIPKCFDYVLLGYKKEFKGSFKIVENKIKDIVRRGRYR